MSTTAKQSKSATTKTKKKNTCLPMVMAFLTTCKTLRQMVKKIKRVWAGPISCQASDNLAIIYCYCKK